MDLDYWIEHEYRTLMTLCIGVVVTLVTIWVCVRRKRGRLKRGTFRVLLCALVALAALGLCIVHWPPTPVGLPTPPPETVITDETIVVIADVRQALARQRFRMAGVEFDVVRVIRDCPSALDILDHQERWVHSLPNEAMLEAASRCSYSVESLLYPTEGETRIRAIVPGGRGDPNYVIREGMYILVLRLLALSDRVNGLPEEFVDPQHAYLVWQVEAGYPVYRETSDALAYLLRTGAVTTRPSTKPAAQSDGNRANSEP